MLLPRFDTCILGHTQHTSGLIRASVEVFDVSVREYAKRMLMMIGNMERGW